MKSVKLKINYKNKIKFIIGWIITCCFLYYSLEIIDTKNFINQLEKINIFYVILSIILLLLDYVLRIIRWKIMFNSANYTPSLWLCGRYFFIGNALNNILPMRYGDFYRLIEFSKKTNIPSGTVMATVALERVFDLISLLFLR